MQERYYYPWELEQAIAQWVAHYTTTIGITSL